VATSFYILLELLEKIKERELIMLDFVVALVDLFLVEVLASCLRLMLCLVRSEGRLSCFEVLLSYPF
jgi:hypothetical protein